MFDPQSQAIVINTAPAPQSDPETEFRRGDCLTALWVTAVACAVLWPGANSVIQKSLGVLVRGETVATANAPATDKKQAMSAPTPNNPNSDELGKRAISMMQAKGYQVQSDANIIYIRDFHCRAFDRWCDAQLVVSGDGKVLYQGRATTRPGATYYARPANPSGVFEIASGQYSAWRLGTHCGLSGSRCHEALVQVAPVTGTRAFSTNRSDARPASGIFGINLHGSTDPRETVGPYSAGCLVADTMNAHQKFMDTIRPYARGTVTATILDWED